MIGIDSSALSHYGYLAPAAQAHIGLFHPDNRQDAPSRAAFAATDAPATEHFLYRKTNDRPLEASGESEKPQDDAAHEEGERSEGTRALTAEEQEQVEALKERDAEVRRHEAAHVRAGGQYAGAPQYEYQTGPDGARYAVGGSVEIDTSEVPGDPRATLEKARAIKRAALAPDEPSSQDRKVAREAEQMAADAMRQLAEQQNGGGEAAPVHAAPAYTSPAPPQNAGTDTNTESAPAPDAATDIQQAASERSALVEIASNEQSLRRYRTAQLKLFYLPITSRLNDDAQRVPFQPLFDRYV